MDARAGPGARVVCQNRGQCPQLATNVVLVARARHQRKEVEAALRFAEQEGVRSRSCSSAIPGARWWRRTVNDSGSGAHRRMPTWPRG